MNIKEIIKKNILNEARGIAESAVPYANAVIDRVNKELNTFLKRTFKQEYLDKVATMRIGGALPLPDYLNTLELPYKYLASYIDDDIFEDFPLVSLKVGLTFRHVETEATAGEKFAVGGGSYPIFAGVLSPENDYSSRVKPEAYPISKRRRESIDRGVAGSIDFDIVTFLGFDPNNEADVTGLKKELHAVIFHEMAHLYESTKNKNLDIHVFNKTAAQLKNSPKKKSRLDIPKAQLDTAKFVGIPKELRDATHALLRLYYLSLPTEVVAMTHEMYLYVMDHDVNSFFENTAQGKIVKALMEFNEEAFLQVLEEEAEKYFERIDIEFSEEKMNTFFEQIRKILIARYISFSTEHHYVMDKNFIKQKSLPSLIHYMSRQIGNAGKRLHRNVGRLYSLKSEL